MSAGVFPPTSSRSTRPRTSSTRTPEFAGYADSMKDRCPSGSAPAFLRRRRGRPDRIVGSRGAGGPSPQEVSGGMGPPGEKSRPSPPMGDLTVRGPTMRLLVRGPHVLPEPSLAFPGPGLASSPSPRCSASSPRCFSPEPTLCAHAPPLSSALFSTLLGSPRSRHRSRRCDLAGRKRAFACGVPGALPGTRASPTRFDEGERPVSRERLDMRGTHSHEASSWARGYYAE